MGESSFALGRFRDRGHTFAGLVLEDRVLDLTGPAGGITGAAPLTVESLLEKWHHAVVVLAELAARPGAGWRPVADVTTLAPVQPRQIFQSGANYRTHVIDLAVAHRRPDDPRSVEEVRADAAAMMDRRIAEGTPYLFIGLPSAVTGPYDDIVLPGYSDQHDWELELAVVIGKAGFRVDRAGALDHVAGYTIVNDLTTRDLVFRRDMPEIGTDWLRAKNAPGFLPTGPYVVPSRFVPDPKALQITLRLNGQTMQDASTDDMIFDVSALVSAASQITPLLPGDLILTGSPAGNGMHWGRMLRDGDLMEGTITGLGTQRNRCVAAGADRA